MFTDGQESNSWLLAHSGKARGKKNAPFRRLKPLAVSSFGSFHVLVTFSQSLLLAFRLASHVSQHSPGAPGEITNTNTLPRSLSGLAFCTRHAKGFVMTCVQIGINRIPVFPSSFFPRAFVRGKKIF
jgi:hypothetical protein